MIGEDLIVQVGMQVLQDPTVQTGIYAVVAKGLTAVVAFITPYILPILAIIGIALVAAAVAILIFEVAKWIIAELA